MSGRLGPLDEEGEGGRALVAFSYTSRVAGDWTRTERGLLEGLVYEAASRNRERDVSGLLMLHRGRFRQWLEGPPTAVPALRCTIFEDPRHRIETARDVVQARGRRYPDWPLRLLAAPEDLPAPRPPVDRLLTQVPGALFVGTEEALPTRARSCGAAVLCPKRAACLRAGQPVDEDCPAVRPWTVADPIRLPHPLTLASAATLGPASVARLLPVPDGADDRAMEALADAVGAAIDRLGEAFRVLGLSEAELTLALADLYRVLRPLCDTPPPRRPRGRILLATLAGSSAVVGPLLEVELLHRAGWRVHLRHAMPAGALARAIAELAPDLVIVAGSRPFVSTWEREELRAFLASRPREGAPPLLLGATLGGPAAPLGAIASLVERTLRERRHASPGDSAPGVTPAAGRESRDRPAVGRG